MSPATRASLRRAARTFVISTLALFVPGLLGWLHALTEWARAEGQTPFPDGRGLAYLGVSAITAGVIATVNLLWNLVEDATGKGLLRNVAPPQHRADTGAVSTRTLAIVAVVVAVVALLLL